MHQPEDAPQCSAHLSGQERVFIERLVGEGDPFIRFLLRETQADSLLMFLCYVGSKSLAVRVMHNMSPRAATMLIDDLRYRSRLYRRPLSAEAEEGGRGELTEVQRIVRLLENKPLPLPRMTTGMAEKTAGTSVPTTMPAVYADAMQLLHDIRWIKRIYGADVLRTELCVADLPSSMVHGTDALRRQVAEYRLIVDFALVCIAVDADALTEKREQAAVAEFFLRVASSRRLREAPADMRFWNQVCDLIKITFSSSNDLTIQPSCLPEPYRQDARAIIDQMASPLVRRELLGKEIQEIFDEMWGVRPPDAFFHERRLAHEQSVRMVSAGMPEVPLSIQEGMVRAYGERIRECLGHQPVPQALVGQFDPMSLSPVVRSFTKLIASVIGEMARGGIFSISAIEDFPAVHEVFDHDPLFRRDPLLKEAFFGLCKVFDSSFCRLDEMRWQFEMIIREYEVAGGQYSESLEMVALAFMQFNNDFSGTDRLLIGLIQAIPSGDRPALTAVAKAWFEGNPSPPSLQPQWAHWI